MRIKFGSFGLAIVLLAAFMICLSQLVYAGIQQSLLDGSTRSLFLVGDHHGNPNPIVACSVPAGGYPLYYQGTYHVVHHGYGASDMSIYNDPNGDGDTEDALIFVTYENSNNVEVFRARDLSNVTTITASGASDLAGIVVDQHKRRVYTVDRGTDRLYVYDADTFALITTVNLTTLGGSGAWGIALDERSDWLFVTNWSPVVHYYDTNTWAEVGTCTTASTHAVGVAYDEDNMLLYTGGSFADDYRLAKYEMSSSATSYVSLSSEGGAMGLAVDPLTGLLYVTTGSQYNGADDLRVFDSSLNCVYIYPDPDDHITNPAGICISYARVNPLTLELRRVPPDTCVYSGARFSYIIAYDNLNNNFDVHNIVLTDILSPLTLFRSASRGGVYDSVTHTVTWNLGDLPAMAPRDSVELAVQVVEGITPSDVVRDTCKLVCDLPIISYDFDEVSGCSCISAWVGEVTTDTYGVVRVPVEISDVTGRGVFSAEAIMNYDPAVLVATGFEISGCLVETIGWSFAWNELSPGRSKVSMAGVSELAGSGRLVVFTFAIADSAPCPGCSDLTLELMFNEGDPCVTITGDGEYCLPVETITGTVRYYGCPVVGNVNPPIPEVKMILSGADSQVVETDSSGTYELEVCVDSCYTVTPEKAPGELLGVSAMDASMVLRYTVNREKLMDCPIYPMQLPDGSWCPPTLVYPQQVAADVSGNGSITAYDASCILKYVVGIDGAHCGEWVFYCDSVDYCPVATSMTDQDFVGVLMGDVSGNWRPGGGPVYSPTVAAVIRAGEAAGAEGEMVNIPVYLETTQGISSLQLTIRHDERLLSVQDVNATGLASGWMIAANKMPGETRIAMAGIDPISGSGEILSISYVVSSDPTVWSCSLTPTDLEADEGAVNLTGVEGIFSIESASVDVDRQQVETGSTVLTNPARSDVHIALSLEHLDAVTVKVFDVSGRLVRNIADGRFFEQGQSLIAWDTRDENGRISPPGIYFVRVSIGSYTRTHRVVLLP